MHFAVPPQSADREGYSVMTRYLVLAAAAAVLSMTAPAAFATRVIFDPPAASLPPTTPPQCTGDAPCSIGLLNHTYQVNFIPCQDVLGVDTTGFSYCLRSEERRVGKECKSRLSPDQ